MHSAAKRQMTKTWTPNWSVGRFLVVLYESIRPDASRARAPCRADPVLTFANHFGIAALHHLLAVPGQPGRGARAFALQRSGRLSAGPARAVSRGRSGGRGVQLRQWPLLPGQADLRP